MLNQNLNQLMKELSVQRPVFHSECDLQHELAMLLSKREQPAKIRLERPYHLDSGVYYIDIYIETTQRIGIELKYKTKSLNTKIDGEVFEIKHHAAVGGARFDFIKDIERLEGLKAKGHIDVGFALLLTNDKALFDKHGNSHRQKELYLHEECILKGTIKFNGEYTEKSIGRHRLKPIVLNSFYNLHWHHYSKNGEKQEWGFKYLVIQV
jgi:hypothetical protein